MGKANQKLRDELTIKHIPFWQLAEQMGVHENTVVRWLRTPLSPETAARVRIAINEITALREGCGENAL